MWNSFCFALFRRQGLCPALCSSFTPIFPFCSLHTYRHQLRLLQSNSLQFLNHGVQISHDGSSPSVMLLFHSLCVALDTFESKAKLGDAYPENTDILCLLTVHNTHIYIGIYIVAMSMHASAWSTPFIYSIIFQLYSTQISIQTRKWWSERHHGLPCFLSCHIILFLHHTLKIKMMVHN